MPTAVFDMLGTFFSLEPLRQRLTALGAPEHTLELWFAETLRDYFAVSHAGGYVPIAEMLEATLPRTIAMVGKGSMDPSRHELVLKGLKVLNPAEGAVDAVNRLAAAGFKLIALTNGSLDATEALLSRANVKDKFSALISADTACTSKPSRDVYALAQEELNGETWMVAAHAWDIMGAHRAGWRTAWISKKEKHWLSTFPRPDIEAPDLGACATLLEARVRGEAHAPLA